MGWDHFRLCSPRFNSLTRCVFQPCRNEERFNEAGSIGSAGSTISSTGWIVTPVTIREKILIHASVSVGQGCGPRVYLCQDAVHGTSLQIWCRTWFSFYTVITQWLLFEPWTATPVVAMFARTTLATAWLWYVKMPVSVHSRSTVYAKSKCHNGNNNQQICT